MKTRITLFIICVFVLSACAPATPHATQTPTPTVLSATPTITPSSMPTVTPTPNYSIDQVKLFRFPESYEYLVAHPEGFVQAPDLLGDTSAFKEWWYDQLIPALGGDWVKMVPNVRMSLKFGGQDNIQYLPDDLSQNVIREPSIFYFKHDGIVYPALIFTIDNGDGNVGTWAYILHSKGLNYGGEGFDAIKNIKNGRMIGDLVGEMGIGPLTGDNEINREFLNSGFNWADYNGGWAGNVNHFAIGLGAIITYDVKN